METAINVVVFAVCLAWVIDEPSHDSIAACLGSLAVFFVIGQSVSRGRSYTGGRLNVVEQKLTPVVRTTARILVTIPVVYMLFLFFMLVGPSLLLLDEVMLSEILIVTVITAIGYIYITAITFRIVRHTGGYNNLKKCDRDTISVSIKHTLAGQALVFSPIVSMMLDFHRGRKDLLRNLLK